MSKSKGNVVSPDAFIDRHGSDVFRMYLMFMGPFTDGGDWSDTGIKGVDRFVQRIWKLISEKTKKSSTKNDHESKEVTASLHRTIKKVTEDIEKMHFNTAISALMELLNLLEKQESISSETAQILVKLIAPLAPHLSEDLWEMLGGKGFVIDQEWPMFNSNLTVSAKVTIAVQVNGKLRGEFSADPGIAEAEAIRKAMELENVQKHLEGITPKKAIYVKGKLVSLVV